jgi:hypothetical protein
MTTELSTQTQPRGLALQSVADAMKFGEMVASSDFAPKDFRGKPASCMLAIQCGAEIGLAPLQSLQSIAVVNGRPAVYGDAALAVVKASPVCEYVTESIEGEGEQMVAVCTARRRGYPQPTIVRFTVADAKKASLWGKSGPWTQYPKRMLQMRARGFALRDAFPDVLKGLVTAEEAQDYPTPVVPPEPAREPVVVRPKFPSPEPASVASHFRPESATQPASSSTGEKQATAEDMRKARHYVQTASQADLERMQGIVEERLRAKFYTPAQADELFNLINGKLDFLSATPEDQGQEFAHEAAEHEVA